MIPTSDTNSVSDDLIWAALTDTVETGFEVTNERSAYETQAEFDEVISIIDAEYNALENLHKFSEARAIATDPVQYTIDVEASINELMF